MKKLLFLLGFITTTCFGQTVLCPPPGSSVIGQQPPTNDTYDPPENPKNPRGKPELLNDRLVFWIHGLGGDQNSWAKVAQATQYQAPGQTVPGYPARKITSLPLTYSQFSLSGAASTLHNMLISTGDPLCNAHNITDKTKNFIVAHSQGGIVSRATDKMYSDLGIEEDRRFGGIVTFGSPHGGARILNNIGQFNGFTNEACIALLAGPAEDAIQSKPVIDFFVSNETWEGIQNKLCNILSEELVPITFKDQFQPLTEDYKVGAAPLAELNGFSSSIPKVALYGTEEEPVLYRTAYSMKVKTPNDFPHFQADSDQPLVDRFNGLLNKYKAKYEQYKQEVLFLEVVMGMPCSPGEWIFHPLHCATYDGQYWKAKKKRDKWKQGVDWLNSSNNKYKAIIGAISSTWVTTYTCACNGYTFPTSNPSCPPGCSLAGQNSTLVVTEKDNDGVVLAESGGAFPGAIVEALPKSNHLQMRNDSNTKAKMLKVLDGGFGDYFITDVR
ncbi:MAG: hypothetical protein JNJ57_00340 [Saprospiraceae bacterium]|nr:hypothetical protein [Saprospiraceae bacterium]